MPRALAALLLLAACATPHVTLAPLATGGTPRERLDRYQAHAPAELGERTLTREGTGEVVQRSTTHLRLPDGRRVEDPVDLIPVVGEDSASGQAAVRARRSRERSRVWYLVAAGAELLAVGCLAYAVANDLQSTPPLVGGSSLVLAGAGAFFIGLHHDQEADEDRSVAFRLYEPDLRARLELCVDGLRVVACEERAP